MDDVAGGAGDTPPLASGDDDGEAIKKAFNERLLGAETLFTLDQRIDVIEEAKAIFPGGNAQFVVDEAHSMGVVGERGLGFVHSLGLDADIAIKTHTFNKAFGSIGGRIRAQPPHERLYTSSER